MIILKMTCGACPEQYDAYQDGKIVGYLRLRNGHFTVQDMPGGDLLYEAHPNGDGVFEDGERDYYLRFAVQAILDAVHNEKPEAPNVDYKIEDSERWQQ